MEKVQRINFIKSKYLEKYKKEHEDWIKQIKKACNDNDVWKSVEDRVINAGKDKYVDNSWFRHYTGLYQLLSQGMRYDYNLHDFLVAGDIKILFEFYTWVMNSYWDFYSAEKFRDRFAIFLEEKKKNNKSKDVNKFINEIQLLLRNGYWDEDC